MSPNSAERGYLSAVSVQDVDLLEKVTLPRSTQTNNALAYAIGRFVPGSSPTYYRVGIGQGTGSSTMILRGQRSDGTFVGSDVPTTITAADGSVVWLRVEMIGTNPTRLQARAWQDGTSEPSSWTLSVTDSNSAEQTAGAVGIRARDDDTAVAHTFVYHSFVASTVAPPPPPPPFACASGAIACDTYQRTVSNGWGSADTGGAWTNLDTSANWSVSPGAGVVSVPPGAQERGYLAQVSAQNVDVLEKVALPQCVQSTSCYAYVLGRITGGATPTYYRIGVRQSAASQHIMLRSQRADGTTLWPELDTGVPAGNGAVVWLRVQFQGTNPTAIRARAWLDGTSEPSQWTLDMTDSTPAMQVSGSIGVRLKDEDTSSHIFNFGAFQAVTLPARAAPGPGFAVDSFNRTVAGGWGTADAGGAWNTAGAAFSVAPGTGTIVANSSSPSNFLTATTAQDVDVLSLAAPPPPASNFYDLGVAARFATSFYQLSAFCSTTNNSGDYTLQVKVKPANTLIVPNINTSIPCGVALWLELQVQGTNPTTLRWRVWEDGTAVPAGWLGTITDSTAALQAAGGVGVEAFSSSGTTSISFENFAAQMIP